METTASKAGYPDTIVLKQDRFFVIGDKTVELLAGTRMEPYEYVENGDIMYYDCEDVDILDEALYLTKEEILLYFDIVEGTLVQKVDAFTLSIRSEEFGMFMSILTLHDAAPLTILDAFHNLSGTRLEVTFEKSEKLMSVLESLKSDTDLEFKIISNHENLKTYQPK